jgi:hypothetical protein
MGAGKRTLISKNSARVHIDRGLDEVVASFWSFENLGNLLLEGFDEILEGNSWIDSGVVFESFHFGVDQIREFYRRGGVTEIVELGFHGL